MSPKTLLAALALLPALAVATPVQSKDGRIAIEAAGDVTIDLFAGRTDTASVLAESFEPLRVALPALIPGDVSPRAAAVRAGGVRGLPYFEVDFTFEPSRLKLYTLVVPTDAGVVSFSSPAPLRAAELLRTLRVDGKPAGGSDAVWTGGSVYQEHGFVARRKAKGGKVRETRSTLRLTPDGFLVGRDTQADAPAGRAPAAPDFPLTAVAPST